MEEHLPRRKLLEHLDDRSEVTQFFQNRPYSFVCIRTWYNEKEYMGYGFSKCMYPDEWSEEDGADIARHRAILMVYREIRARERGQRRMEAWASLTQDVTVGQIGMRSL